LPASARPDLLVVVEAPVGVIRERLAARSSRHSRTQRLDAESQIEELRRGRELLESVATWASVETQVVCNDGRVAPETLAAQVADWVSRITGSPSRPRD
ncbi:MAG TPA: hypothetical protein VEX15_10810, partial [Nocardioidaceae bacterium]|nr:hypothetical protein [Nocardioidaceae bacterium]